MKPDTSKLITINPKIMSGKPCFAGTRIPVDLILEKMSNGEPIEYLLTAYPSLNEEHFYAALDYASNAVKSVYVFPIEG